MEWIIAAVFFLIGLGAAIALYLARRDPLTRDLNLGGSGLFILGRTSLSPRRDDKGKTDAGNGPRLGHRERHNDDTDDRAPPAKQR